MNKKVLYILLSIFIILFLVLGFLGLIYNKKLEKEQKEKEKAAKLVNTKLSSGTYEGVFENKKINLSAAYIVDGIKATINKGIFESANNNEIVFLVVNGGSLNIKDVTINKTGGPSTATDENNFYGLNSGIVVIGKDSKATINNVKINTNGEGANAVFATNSANVSINDSGLKTTANSSRGLDSTYGGVINAKNIKIDTLGEHSAALATDKGGGTVKLVGENVLNTSGEGSPIIYSTGNIQATGITGVSKTSEAIVIEGKNNAYLNNSFITSNGEYGLMLYQSMNRDLVDTNATNKNSLLTIKNSKLKYTGKGPMIYVTNTNAAIKSSNMKFDFTSPNFIKASKDKWGKEKENGGSLLMNTTNQTMKGNIIADDISSVILKISNKSTFTGTTIGTVNISIDQTSKKNIIK